MQCSSGNDGCHEGLPFLRSVPVGFHLPALHPRLVDLQLSVRQSNPIPENLALSSPCCGRCRELADFGLIGG